MKKLILTFVLALISATPAFAQQGGGPGGGQRGGHQSPPEEAYTACEGKQAGDSSEFTTPWGDTISGTCEQMGDSLVLKPENGPQGNMAPPQQ
ncbi:hypothetical protein [Desulfovibrio sp. JC010]|uniref:hypothetical protein n=1 Tax=Desulfovibrio sp. JC010 TaxID=2593641 RepID=UPI0013D0C65A|nr:hypothetical protein [Desulfovibrio sp. JC010]NDV27854.1 hypothetical protein [Desulfovibrio sp. JC010]